ncbi:hypothetical protein [Verrucosispora sp. NA02020]|uniref:hypothetical protein n=1 Tax=Verrucosispora sp. NA02020 TaxID=2742132 RepID=UPI00158FA83B|nr:hypothetical protein [Verrucosispora sp. NA02020]QKW15406.1 hypothetical protein HUT12_23320 [Verrucosispora sp. NA02020]
MTAVQPPRVDQRDCALYRFWVRHPETGERVLGYVGETARLPFQRLMEHIYQQPWADTILAWEVDDTVYAGKAAVLAAEKATVEAEKPLYNVEWNRGNPDRIIPPVAQRQRNARDPQWVAPAQSVRVPRPRGAGRVRTAATSTKAAKDVPQWAGSPEQIKATLWVVAWLVVACVIGRQAASGPVATWIDGAAYGAGSASVLVGLLLPSPKRRRSRR